MTNAAAILNQTGTAAKDLKIDDQIYHDIYATAKLPLQYFGGKLESAQLGFGVSNCSMTTLSICQARKAI